jgi:hypothetical protein
MSNRKSSGSKPPGGGGGSQKPQLSPEIQGKIGQQLRKFYDDVVSQGVPDRFTQLLDRLDKPKSSKPQ